MSAKTLHSAAAEQTIKRLLRHRASRTYFKNGDWTSNPDEASSFLDIVEAAEVCARYGLNDMELALRFDRGANDVFCTPIR
jgi:hypothetical protein